MKCDVCGILCASNESLAKHKLRNHTGQVKIRDEFHCKTILARHFNIRLFSFISFDSLALFNAMHLSLIRPYSLGHLCPPPPFLILLVFASPCVHFEKNFLLNLQKMLLSHNKLCHFFRLGLVPCPLNPTDCAHPLAIL